MCIIDIVTPYLDPKLGDTLTKLTDVKQVRNTTIINKNDVFNRENNIAVSVEKIKTIERMNIANQRIRSTFKDYSDNRISELLKKYATKTISYKTTLEKKKYKFKVTLKVNLVNKIQFETIGKAKNANIALDIALNHIAKRIRRYLRKIKKRNIGRISNKTTESFFYVE